VHHLVRLRVNILQVLLWVHLWNTVASPSCHWGTKTCTSELPYAHCWVVIVAAGNSNGVCDIRLGGSHYIPMAPNHRLVYGRITCFVVGLPLVKLHCHWRGNWPWIAQSELRKDRPNVAVLMDVDRVMVSIAFEVHVEIKRDTPKIMHAQPLVHLAPDLPNEALVRNNEKIIDIENDCRNDYALFLIMEHIQSSLDEWCHEPNRDHEVLKSDIPIVRRLFQAIKTPSQAGYHLLRSHWSLMVVLAPILEQTKVSLWWVQIDLFLQVNSQESCAFGHLMDLEIILGSDGKGQPNVAQARGRCISSLVGNIFDLIISSTD